MKRLLILLAVTAISGLSAAAPAAGTEKEKLVDEFLTVTRQAEQLSSSLDNVAKMQQQMMKAQEDLDAREYEGTAGGGAVSCKVSGKRQLLSLTIDKDAVDPEEVEMLQDMIVAAVNDALKKGEETRESEMSKIGGAGMGGMF